MSGQLERKRYCHYPKQLRLEVVELYLTDQKDLWELVQDYKISSSTLIHHWVRRHGEEVRERLDGTPCKIVKPIPVPEAKITSPSSLSSESSNPDRYTKRFRMEVVEAYLSGDMDMWELQETYSLPRAKLIRTWVRKHESEVRERMDGTACKIVKPIPIPIPVPEAKITSPSSLSSESSNPDRYTKRFRMEVVEAYLSGDMDMWELQETYSLPRTELIRTWVRKHESEVRERLALEYVPLPIMKPENKEDNKLAALEEEIKRLKGMLSNSNLKAEALETLIDLAEKTYNLPIRKNFAAKQSKNYNKGTRK